MLSLLSIFYLRRKDVRKIATGTLQSPSSIDIEYDALALNRFHFSLVATLATVGLLNTNASRAPPYPMVMLMDVIIFGCIFIHAINGWEATMTILHYNSVDADNPEEPNRIIPEEFYMGINATVFGLSIISCGIGYLRQRSRKRRSAEVTKHKRALKKDSYGDRGVASTNDLRKFEDERVISDLYKLFDCRGASELDKEKIKWLLDVNKYREFQRKHTSAWGRLSWPAGSVQHTKPWEQSNIKHANTGHFSVGKDTSWVAGDKFYMNKLNEIRTQSMQDVIVRRNTLVAQNTLNKMTIQEEGPVTVYTMR